jgi:hypothetical protein
MTIARSIARPIASPIASRTPIIGGGLDPTLRLSLDYTQAPANIIGPLPTRTATAFDANLGILISTADEVATLSGTDFTSVWNADAGTIVVEFSKAVLSPTALFGIVQFSEASAVLNRLQISVRQTGSISFQIVNNNSAQVALETAGGVYVAGSQCKIAAAYQSGSCAMSVNGAAVLTSGNAITSATRERMRIGTNETILNGHVKRLRYFNERKPNAFLQSVTA